MVSRPLVPSKIIMPTIKARKQANGSLGKTIAHTLTAADLIRHVHSRRAEGAGPATVINDLIWIGVVLRAAKSVKELPVVPEIVQQARSACRELRLVGKPKKRTRRPTADELT